MFRVLKIIPNVRHQFGIYIILVLVLGHLGVAFGYILNKNQMSLIQYLEKILNNGVLYNMGISFIATSIYPLIVGIIDENTKFRGFRILRITASFVIIVVYTGLFAVYLNDGSRQSMIVQSVSYFVAICLTIYLFLYQFLETDYESFSDLDDKCRDELSEKISHLDQDDRGVKT